MRLHGILALSVVLSAPSLASVAIAQPTSAPPDGWSAPVAPFEELDETIHEPLRLRFGVEGTGGAFLDGPQVAIGGLRANVGVQIGEWLSISYMPTMLGGVFTAPVTSDSAMGLLYNTALVELTLFDVFQLGAGPSLDFMWGCDETSQDPISCGDGGAFFGLDGRVSVLLMEHMFGGRTAVGLSADIHPTWYAQDTLGVTVLGGLGLHVY